MKKNILCLYWLCLLSTGSYLKADNLFIDKDVFSLCRANQESTSIRQSFSAKDVLQGFTIDVSDNRPIFGAAVSAHITLSDNAGLARVVLIDNAGNEYLIYEIYSLIANARSFDVDNVCDESRLLNSVTPLQLRVELLNASIDLHQLATVNAVPYPQGELVSIIQAVRKEQEKRKIEILNKSIKQKGLTWTAGHTNTSSLTYSRKKNIFSNNGLLADLQGFEYYAGGVFNYGYNEGEQRIQKRTTLTMVDSFDWRNRHGANNPKSPYYDGDTLGGGWATPIRNQYFPQGCLSCASHCAIAPAELW